MGVDAEFAGKRAVVMGLGRFGGGVGVTRFLVDRGADVLVTDREPADKLEQSVAQIRDLVDAGSVSLRLGEHNISDFTTRDLVVVNPAVPPDNRFVRAAEAAGIEVTTEMRLLVERLPNRLRTIGVTGSAGKSTVTAMIGHVLNKVFSTPNRQDAKTPSEAKVWVGGNIGVSLLPQVDEIGEDDWVVLELSSFMLERLRADEHFRGWSPHIAVVTNISPNHLDWHGSMADYIAAKEVILSYQDDGDFAVLGPASGFPSPVASRGQTRTVEPESSEGVVRLEVPGSHNRTNAMCALAACHSAGVDWPDPDAMYASLADFPGLPHRLQLVAEHNGVRYFNDSKCTTPEAAQLAIQAFAEEKGDGPRFVHLILGGKDKGSDMKPLAGLAASTCKAVYTIGALGETIAGLIDMAIDTAAEAASAGAQRPDSCGGVSWPAESHQSAEVVRCGELNTAVAEIRKRVSPGDVVLLSPACASWDQFENYEQRGERFIELVKAHTAG